MTRNTDHRRDALRAQSIPQERLRLSPREGPCIRAIEHLAVIPEFDTRPCPRSGNPRLYRPAIMLRGPPVVSHCAAEASGRASQNGRPVPAARLAGTSSVRLQESI